MIKMMVLLSIKKRQGHVRKFKREDRSFIFLAYLKKKVCHQSLPLINNHMLTKEVSNILYLNYLQTIIYQIGLMKSTF